MPTLKQILVPTDFSRNNSRAINYACDLAGQTAGRLHLIHATHDDLPTNQNSIHRLERMAVMIDTHFETPIDATRKVVEGEPAAAIVDYANANGIDLIVMGTHGRTGLAHLTMGGVTEKVIRAAPCPVLVLGPHDGENASLQRAASTLADLIGDGLNEKEETGRGIMLRELVEKLRIPSTTAILLFDELEDRNWVRYENGSWTILKGIELAELQAIFVPEFSTDSPAIDLIKRAKKMRATDIHIDPAGKDGYQIRFRVDGKLREYCRLQDHLAHQMINRLKTLAGVNIADPFHPAEAGLKLPQAMSDIDVRMTAIPVAGGTAIALRLFDADKIALPISNLGYSDQAMESVQSILRRGEGLVLVTGPTGSGKTTTVYSMLQSLSGAQQNIVSVEDPVEFEVPYIRQMAVDLKHGVTMTEGLRTILRMDPDVVFVGEIRDLETAKIGMRAASSGKYVFSTMHTRDIASTIMGLRDLGVDLRSVAGNLSGVINQRLVRKLCPDCRLSDTATPEQRFKFESAGLPTPDLLFKSVGCANCHGSGYHGRIGVFEVASFTPEIRSSIANNEPVSEIEKRLRASGSVSLESDALSKAAEGLISFEEAVGIRWLA